MFKLLRYLFLGVLAIVLIALALANRDLVVLRVLPPEAGDFLSYNFV